MAGDILNGVGKAQQGWDILQNVLGGKQQVQQVPGAGAAIGAYGSEASYSSGLFGIIKTLNNNLATDVLKINQNPDKQAAFTGFLGNALKSLNPEANPDLLTAMNEFAKTKNLPELKNINELTGAHLGALMQELKDKNRLDHDLLKQGKGGLLYDAVDALRAVELSTGLTSVMWAGARKGVESGVGPRPTGAAPGVTPTPTPGGTGAPASDAKLTEIEDKLAAAAGAKVQLGKPSKLLEFMQNSLNFINGNNDLPKDGQPSQALLDAINKYAASKNGPPISSLDEVTPVHLRALLKDMHAKGVFNGPYGQKATEVLGSALQEINDPELQRLGKELAPKKPQVWGYNTDDAPVVVASAKGGHVDPDAFDPIHYVSAADDVVLESDPVVAPPVAEVAVAETSPEMLAQGYVAKATAPKV